MFFEHLLLNSLNTMLDGGSEGKLSSQMQIQDIGEGSVQLGQWLRPDVSNTESINIWFQAIGKSARRRLPKTKDIDNEQ